MKFVIETGSASHSTSYASCQAKFVDGPEDGKHLYEARQYQIKTQWDSSKNERWVTTEYNLPEGTQVAVIGKGRRGPRGSEEYAFHRVYRLDSTAEVIDDLVDVGLRCCTVKGRMVLVGDMLADDRVNMEDGF